MSEFSTLTTKLITPLLKQRGFKKHGSFLRTSTCDTAVYRRGGLELRLIFSVHGYDYPEIGIRMRLRDANGMLFDRLHPPTEGGMEAMLRAVVSDIESGVGGV